MKSRSLQFMAAMAAYDANREAEALRLMEVCAAEGDPVACYLAALWHRNGEGTIADDVKSSYWQQQLVRLAESGNSEAQWELGQYLRFGDVFPADVQEANRWLEQAAQSGCGTAQHHLAWYLETGQYGYAQDRQAAEDWYRRAFEQGHPETLYTFALREFKGGQITETAIALLKRAADKGFKQAQHILRGHTH